MTIETGTGNLLASSAEALVNTVNTVGVMGKGIALQFKNAYPEAFKAYAAACKRGEVETGKMFVFETGQLGPSARFIINFPTKKHWKGKSKLEYIETGLVDLVRVVRELGIVSIAVPPLGCGNGGLQWSVVEPLIRGAFDQLPEVTVFLHAPDGAPANEEMVIRTAAPSMTGPRAAILAVMRNYLLPEYQLTAIEVQKLAYFVQAFGYPMKLNYVKGTYGPYAENLNHALQALEGHFVRGYGDRSSEMALRVLPEAYDPVEEYLASDDNAAEVVRRVTDLVRGFETPYGLELLATTHWASKELDSADPSAVLAYVQAWTPRKGEIFTAHHIAKALQRLESTSLAS